MMKHKLVRELFSEEQTPQRTHLMMHILVSELISYTTQPRHRTDSVKHRFMSDLIR
jgi:hypothetical protein